MTNYHYSCVVTITGPSGTGKTVLSNLLEQYEMSSVISTTTRLPRKNEIQNKDYHFINKNVFEDKIKNQDFIETIVYNNQYYGVAINDMIKASEKKAAILVAEPHGVKQIEQFCQKNGWSIIKVFINNPSHILCERLLNRLHENIYKQPGKKKMMTSSPCFNYILNAIEDENSHLSLLEKYLVDFLKSSDCYHQQEITQDNIYIIEVCKRIRGFLYEQKNWVKPAENGQDHYDCVFDSFHKENENFVVKTILQKIEEKKMLIKKFKR